MIIAICDDIKRYNTQLRELLINYAKRNQITDHTVTEYTCSQSLLSGYHHGRFDCIFLDADMPILDGFKTAKKIREADMDVSIVFVTNMESQMRMGYKYGAKGMLLFLWVFDIFVGVQRAKYSFKLGRRPSRQQKNKLFQGD